MGGQNEHTVFAEFLVGRFLKMFHIFVNNMVPPLTDYIWHNSKF